MSIASVIIAELEEEAQTTRRVFERIPENRQSWKPHEKSRSLGQLALHIAQLPAGVCSMVVPDVCEVPTMGEDPQPQSLNELMKELDVSLSRAKEILSKMDDYRLMSNLTIQSKGKTLFSVPRMSFLRSVLLNHNYHHRGQLTVYLRLLNVPVPFIYGPSADENPFATM